MTDVTEPAIDIFGDESCRGRWVVFGALAMPPSAVAEFEYSLARLKIDFGNAGDAELHCRVMFSGDQRSKKGSPWKHLRKSDVFTLYTRLAELARDQRLED